MGKSLMEQLALMPEDERAAVLQGVDMDNLVWDWRAWARPEQIPPSGDDWSIWLYMAGRGAGKTRSAAEWIREKAKDTSQGQIRFALVARTAADVRDVIVEGESGIISVSPPSEKPLYEPSKRRLTWPNGNTATCFCASDDTEVLTRDRGWVQHSDLQAGDWIMTLNTSTRRTEWQQAEGVYRFTVDDVEMVRMHGRSHDSLTTMNHRWPLIDRSGSLVWKTSRQVAEAGLWQTKLRMLMPGGHIDGATSTDIKAAFKAKVEKYTGIVWCPKTANSTWLARRNGKVYFTGNTADEPDGLRGPQFHYAWADEMAAWRQSPDAAGMTSWDNLRVACRLGRAPQIIATTTPKRVPILYSLLDEAKKTGRVIVSRGSTLDNAGNLSSTYLDAITGVYAGTRLAAQELYGEMLDAVEGALWTEELVEQWRESRPPVNTPLRVIGVDPSVAENPKDECGIVVCASTADRDLYKRHAWVLEDATIHGSPQQWANVVVSMARKYACPVVAEVNQGGALVTNAILAIDPNIRVLEVHSKHGKALRAEPVVLAYEQGRVHHVNYLPDLESQMLAWIPGEGKSPDRVDALVHALTALLIKPPPGFVGGQITARSVASRRLPSFRGPSGGQSGGRVFRVR